MGRASRQKGANGERELVNLLKGMEVRAMRTAPLQTGQKVPDVTLLDWPEAWVEVKRDERLSVDAMIRQAEADAPEGHTPIVAFRRNQRPWSVVLPLPAFVEMIGGKS